MSKERLTERLENFRNGRWIDLVCDPEKIVAATRFHVLHERDFTLPFIEIHNVFLH